MWDRLSIFCALAWVALGAPFSPTPCPEQCTCDIIELTGQLNVTCATLNFLEKLKPKQVNDIVSLELSNLNIYKLHSKLKKLKNLKSVNLSNNRIHEITELSFLPKLNYLNLKSNHIKYFTATSLPRHLQHLDISNNYLTYIPHGLIILQQLKEIDLSDNPISCTCDTIKEHDLLLKAGISLLKPVKCHSPEKLRGQLLQAVSCMNYDLNEYMQGDEPAVEGSGNESPELKNAYATETLNELNAPGIEDEGFLGIPKVSQTYENIEVEGSGYIDISTTLPPEEDDDEGSGDDEALIIPTFIDSVGRPRSCHFNCTEVKINANNNTNEENPDILKEFGIAIGLQTEGLPQTTTATVKESTKVESNERITGKGDTAAVEKSTEINKSSWNTNLIIVIALIAIMLCLVIFSIMKKKRNRRSENLETGEEMKPLNMKPVNGNNIPEKTPLMNGQNGNMNSKPAEESVDHTRNELDSKIPSDDEDVDSQKNKDEDTLLPETHKVTIQAKELSTPKTPLLVNRHRSDDGNIITTPTSEQTP